MKFVKSSSKKNRTFMLLYLFIVMFAPPIIPRVNILLPVSIISLILLITKYKYKLNKILSFSNIKLFSKKYFLSYLLLLIIVLSNIILTGNFYFENFAIVIYRLVILMIAQIITILFLIVKAELYDYKFEDILKFLFIVVLIQGFIGILAISFPNIKYLLVNVMETNTGSKVFSLSNATMELRSFRFNGFSATLLDIFGYGTGIVAGISAIYGFSENSKYLIVFILLLVPSVLNSRSGIMLGIIGLLMGLCLSVFNTKKKRTLKSIFFRLVSLLIFIIITPFIIKVIMNTSSYTMEWIADGFGNIYNLLIGKQVRKYSVADSLFSTQFWSLPNNIIFGSGHRLYGMGPIIGMKSDVGYINHLWLGGIVGLLLIYYPFNWLFYKSFKKATTSLEKYIIIYLIISFYIMLIKIDTIGYNPGIFVTLLVLFTFLLNKNKEGFNEKNIHNNSTLQ